MDLEQKAWYISSKGTGLSLTIRGLLVSVLPLAISAFHWNTASADFFISTLVNFVQAISTTISLGMILFGMLRKGYYSYFPSQ